MESAIVDAASQRRSVASRPDRDGQRGVLSRRPRPPGSYPGADSVPSPAPVTLRGRRAGQGRPLGAASPGGEIFSDTLVSVGRDRDRPTAIKPHHDLDAELCRADENLVGDRLDNGKAPATFSAAWVRIQANTKVTHRDVDGVVISPTRDLDRPDRFPRVCVEDDVRHRLGNRQADSLTVGSVKVAELRCRVSCRCHECRRGRKLDLVSHLHCDHFRGSIHHFRGSFLWLVNPLKPPLGPIRRLPAAQRFIPFGFASGSVAAGTTLRPPACVRQLPLSATSASGTEGTRWKAAANHAARLHERMFVSGVERERLAGSKLGLEAAQANDAVNLPRDYFEHDGAAYTAH